MSQHSDSLMLGHFFFILNDLLFGGAETNMGRKGKKAIAAVICNYNKSQYVTECIQSVLESAFTDFDVIVVDNASTDDSVKRIKEKYEDEVTLLVNAENLGGSGGFNTGIRYALEHDYSYVWCLDNDVLVDEKAIGELYSFLEKHAEAGMAGSKVYHMEAPDYVQQFGIDIDWEDFCCEAKYCNFLEDGTMPEVVYSDAVAACSVLVRTSLIREIGMLPEDNFLYWDDTEWGYQCNLAGYKVASVGASKVLHCMGAKKEGGNTFPTYYAWRNWLQFFIRYTEEEKLERMCESFLEGIFEIVYDGYYKGEINRARTVMFAYDDAIHGVKGRAMENRIFEVDKNSSKLSDLLKGLSCVKIKKQEEDLEAEELKAWILEINPGMELWEEAAAGSSTGSCQKTFILCRNIFSLEDYSLKDIYVDIEGRILATEEDVFKVFNKAYSYQTFLYMQKPLFLEQARKLRKG